MISKEEIEKMAELSRISISEEEKKQLAIDIESILQYVSEIQEVSVEEPVSSVGLVHNVMREDGEPHESGIYTEEIMGEVPKKEKNYLVVKKIL